MKFTGHWYPGCFHPRKEGTYVFTIISCGILNLGTIFYLNKKGEGILHFSVPFCFVKS